VRGQGLRPDTLAQLAVEPGLRPDACRRLGDGWGRQASAKADAARQRWVAAGRSGEGLGGTRQRRVIKTPSGARRKGQRCAASIEQGAR